MVATTTLHRSSGPGRSPDVTLLLAMYKPSQSLRRFFYRGTDRNKGGML